MNDDERRFDAVFRDTYPRVVAYGRRRASDAVAQDVAAETYAIAWRRRRRLPAGELALPWLLAIARRVLANHARGERRRLRLWLRLSDQPAPDESMPDAGGDEVLAALLALAPADREILRLAYWDDLSPAQIAATLGVSTDAANVRLHRARRRLLARLSPRSDNHAKETSHAR